MNRRHYMAIAVAAGLSESAAATVVLVAEVACARGSAEALLRDIDQGHDKFPPEREAFELASHLSQLAKVAAASPSTAKPDIPHENGWNALSEAVHRQYSEADRQQKIFYVQRGGRYYDFSGVSGIDFANDSRAFTMTSLDGHGNVDLILKSRLGPQVQALQNNCGNTIVPGKQGLRELEIR